MKDDQQRAGYEMEANRLTREKLEAEAARDHLRARLRELAEKWKVDAPDMIGGNEMIACANQLLAILSELEEEQQTEKEPDHARMDRKADAGR